MLRRVLVHIYIYVTETQQVSTNGNSGLVSKVCDGLRGDAFVAAQQVVFDNLCEIVDGKPRGIDTLIQQM